MARYNKATYVRGVEQKCAECIYDPSSQGGTWREQVAACTDTSCPLFNIRPLPEGMEHPPGKFAFVPSIVERRRREVSRVGEGEL